MDIHKVTYVSLYIVVIRSGWTFVIDRDGFLEVLDPTMSSLWERPHYFLFFLLKKPSRVSTGNGHIHIMSSKDSFACDFSCLRSHGKSGAHSMACTRPH